MNLVGVQAIIPHINNTITKMKFTSINVRMMLPDKEIMTSSDSVSLYIKRPHEISEKCRCIK